MRDSLHLQTIRLSTQAERLAWLADHINELPGTGIIYTLTVRDAEQVSEWLNSRGILVRPYHANVEDEHAFPTRTRTVSASNSLSTATK